MSNQSNCQCHDCGCATRVAEGAPAVESCQCAACGCGANCRCTPEARCSDACYCV
jgi:hypothetical protein